MSDESTYQRLLLGLQPGKLDAAAFRAAAELARELGLQMLAVLVEDPSIASAATLPFARELRLPTHDWQPADPDRMALELQRAVEQVRQQLAQECEAAGIECSLEIRRGDPATAIVDLCSLQDIIAVTEPMALMDLMTGISGRMRKAALESPATVLLLPAHLDRQDGTIVALAAGAADTALALAARMAARSRRRLLVLATREAERTGEAAREAARAAGLPAGSVEVAPFRGRTAEALIHALAHRHVYCLVKTRSTLELPAAALEELSSRLGTPVLLVEPGAAAA